LAEELAAKLNAITKCSSSTLAYKEWPKWDESVLTEDTITLPVQINGKVRDRIELPKDASKDDAEAAALATDKIKEQLEGKTVRKIIVVPGRLVNIVAN
jgi:leucyl-tRNA synthetase